MLGRTHAASGLAAGLALAPALGMSSLTAVVPFAVTTAGYALVPDLDHPKATPSRLLGPLTGLLSRGLTTVSKGVYAATRGPEDDYTVGAGGHRAFTHTIAFGLLLGALAAGTSLASPWVVAGWLAFGALACAAALGEWAILLVAASIAIPAFTHAGSALALLASMQGPIIGIAVTLGALTHLAGDGLTRSGIPAAWPLPLAGQRWRELHALPEKTRLRTGRTPEKLLIFPALIALAVALALPYFVHIPDLASHLRHGITHSLTSATSGS
jgi:membrane-bound metal-dependent hydrolase YbcI (DUF457 family)